MSPPRHRWTLQASRHLTFTGRLRMRSALHVGGSVGTQSLTDTGVIRHPDGRPFIPGSSMKGVLRSHLERLVAAPTLQHLGIRSCGLYEGQDDECPTPTWIEERKKATEATEEDFEKLCHTCTLFGSPILAGKVRIPDLEVDANTFSGQYEVRDGVGIDRDTGLAVKGVKYDYEVVPSETVFRFELSVENPDPVELGLLAVAVRELEHGHLAIGGKTTRGLGACELGALGIVDADFGSGDPSDLSGLQNYLKRQSTPVADPDAFLDAAIDDLLAAS